MLSTLLVLHLLASSQTPPPLVSGPPPVPAPAPAPVLRWYGVETLIADGVAVLATGIGFSLTSAGLANPGNGIGGGGIGLYLFTTPILHARHENWWGVLGSLGLRVAALMGGGLTGAIVAIFRHGIFSQRGNWEEMAIGATAGEVIGAVIDAQNLAWEPVPAAQPPASATSTWRWAPFAGSVRGAPVAGVAGLF